MIQRKNWLSSNQMMDGNQFANCWMFQFQLFHTHRSITEKHSWLTRINGDPKLRKNNPLFLIAKFYLTYESTTVIQMKIHHNILEPLKMSEYRVRVWSILYGSSEHGTLLFWLFYHFERLIVVVLSLHEFTVLNSMRIIFCNVCRTKLTSNINRGPNHSSLPVTAMVRLLVDINSRFILVGDAKLRLLIVLCSDVRALYQLYHLLYHSTLPFNCTIQLYHLLILYLKSAPRGSSKTNEIINTKKFNTRKRQSVHAN